MKGYAQECVRVLRPITVIRYAQALDLFLRYLHERAGQKQRLSPDLLTKRLLSEWCEYLKTHGLHGRPRKSGTIRKLVGIIQLAWEWGYNDDEFGDYVPRPRRIRLPPDDGLPPIAPTWEEMDGCIHAIKTWQKHLCIVLRFTGLRVQQAMGLRWTDFDFERGLLHFRGELGKSKQERRGRVIPVSPHLLAELETWERKEEWLIVSDRKPGSCRERLARSRDTVAAWQRAGVREEAWKQPHHAFRKGFITGLKRAGADTDAVEYLVGHSLGLRGVYTDPEAFGLREAVALVPALTPPAK